MKKEQENKQDVLDKLVLNTELGEKLREAIQVYSEATRSKDISCPAMVINVNLK